MADIRAIQSERLSTFRTQHDFQFYGEFQTVEEFLEFQRWASANSHRLYILGNGSNTLYTRRRIRTLILKNRLDAWMNDLGEGRLECSSSLPVMRILKHCEASNLDSFYYLASVPATFGGALAMNAGLGVGGTIYDFVESVTYIEDGRILTVRCEDLERAHRKTMFTGVHDRLIISGIVKFPSRPLESSEIRKRIEWCHSHQDIRFPNCGSVFRTYTPWILRRIRGLPVAGIKYPFFHTQFTRKVNNWIICNNRSSWPIVCLIRFVQGIHRLFGKRAETELIEVD